MRLGAEVPLTVNADADCIGFHVALSDDKHGVNFHLFGALDLAVDLVRAFVDLSADLVSTQFLQNRSCVLN